MLLLSLAGMLFALGNPASITLLFGRWPVYQGSLAGAIVGAAAIGGMLMLLLILFRQSRLVGYVRWLLLLLLALTTFALGNTAPTTLLFWQWPIYRGPLAVAIVGAVMMGGFVMLLPILLRQSQLVGRIRELERDCRSYGVANSGTHECGPGSLELQPRSCDRIEELAVPTGSGKAVPLHNLWRWVDPLLVVALTIPLVLLLANRQWLFPFGNASDAWWNLGAYFEWGRRDHAEMYQSYKFARLSWILKGALAHRLFSPIVAHYALHLTMFFAAMVIFYLIVKRLFDRRVAFLATVAFATYSEFHSIRSFEWDYGTHDAIVNLLATLLFLLAAASTIQWPYMLGYLPAMVFWYAALRERHAPGPWVSLRYFLVGGICVTALYCFVNYSVGGPIFYFWPQLQFLIFYGASSRFGGQWLPLPQELTNQALQFPILMAFSAISILAYVRWSKRQDYATSIVACSGTFLLCTAAHVGGFLNGNPLLHDPHMVVALTPTAFLCCAALFATMLGRPSGVRVADGMLAAAAYVLFVAPLLFGETTASTMESIQSLWIWSFGKLSPSLAHSVVAGGFFGAPGLILGTFLIVVVPIGFALSFLRRLNKWVVVTAILLSTVNAGTALIPLTLYSVTFDCGYLDDQFKAVIDAYRAIKVSDPEFVSSLWFKGDEVLPFPKASCSNRRFAYTYGGTSPGIQLTPLYDALWYTRQCWQLQPSPSPDDSSAVTAVEFRDGGGRVAPPLPCLFGGFRGTESFSWLPHAGYWLKRTPNPLRLEVLSSDPEDGPRAAATLRRLGATVRRLGMMHIHEGMISFDITFLEVAR